MHCDGGHHIFQFRLTQNRHILQRTVNYAHSSKIWCQMNQWFQMKIILKHSPTGFMVNLALESTWISNGHKKKSNFVRDHSMIIYVLFGFNQRSGFWEKTFFFHFPIWSYDVKNMPCVGDQLGFCIQKKA